MKKNAYLVQLISLAVLMLALSACTTLTAQASEALATQEDPLDLAVPVVIIEAAADPIEETSV